MERRAERFRLCGHFISWPRSAIARRRTVESAESCTSREQRCFPTTTTSAFSISCQRAGWWSQLTWYRELALGRSPVLIENPLKVGRFARLSVLRPKCMTAFYFDLDAHLGCRRNSSTHAYHSTSVRSGEPRNIRALDWCPGPVVSGPQCSLFIFYEQPQRIPRIQDI